MFRKRTFPQKIYWYISCFFIRVIKFFNEDAYKILYPKLLSKMGVDISQDKSYIDPSAYFDNYDYSLIHIGKNVTISREVLLLTHDYSICVGLKNIESKHSGGIFLKEIIIEDNCFIGARTTILPGTHIKKNCIIGSNSVIKGEVQENSIVIGNPSKVIGDTIEWTKKHVKKADFLRFNE